MNFDTLTLYASTDIKSGDTVTFNYPSGRSASSYLASGSYIRAFQSNYKPTFTFGKTSATAVWAGPTIPFGTRYRVSMALADAVPALNSDAILAGGGALADHVWYNTDANLSKIRAAIQNARLGATPCKILCVGESTTAGVGAGVPINSTSVFRKYAYPDLLAKYLNGLDASLVTRVDSVFGIQGFSTSGYFNINPAITGANWGSTTGLNSIGGSPFSNTTNTNPLVYTPGTTFDRIEIGYWVHPTLADDLLVDIGGATLATLTGAGAAAYGVATVNCTRGQNTVNIRGAGNGGTSRKVFYIRCYDSTSPAIEVFNAGVGGTNSAYWATNANGNAPGCDPIHSLQTFAPNLTIFDDGINDLNQGTSLSAYKINIQALITAAKVSGDVMILTPNPTNAANVLDSADALAKQLAQNAILKDLAYANDCVFVDIFGLLGGGIDKFQADGLNYDTGPVTHPNARGYSLKASTIAQVLLAAF